MFFAVILVLTLGFLAGGASALGYCGNPALSDTRAVRLSRFGVIMIAVGFIFSIITVGSIESITI